MPKFYTLEWHKHWKYFMKLCDCCGVDKTFPMTSEAIQATPQTMLPSRPCYLELSPLHRLNCCQGQLLSCSYWYLEINKIEAFAYPATIFIGLLANASCC